MESWYVLSEATTEHSASTSGPFTRDQLAVMVHEGSLLATTRVARAGAAEWLEAGIEPSLAGLFRSEPPRVPELAIPIAGATALPAYSFSNAMEIGFRTFKAQWGMLVLVTLLIASISFVLAIPNIIGNLAGQAAMQVDGERAGIALWAGGACCSWVLQVLIGGPLFAGAVYCGAQAVEGRLQVGDVFVGFRRYGQALGASLLLAAVYVGAALVSYAPAVLCAIIGFTAFKKGGGGMVAMLIIGVVFTLAAFVLVFGFVVMRVIYVPAMVVDPSLGQVGVIDAFQRSWEITRGKGFSLLGLMIVASILAALTVLCCGVGYVLIGIPLCLAIAGAAYSMLYRRKNAPAI